MTNPYNTMLMVGKSTALLRESYHLLRQTHPNSLLFYEIEKHLNFINEYLNTIDIVEGEFHD